MRFTHWLAVAFASCFLTIACGGEPSVAESDQDKPSAGTDIAQGVQITKQTKMDLRVVATNGDARISIVIHRLGLRPQEFVVDPSIESKYDADLLVRNRRGYSFIASGNTGLPLDPDTGDYPEPAKQKFEQQQQVEDLQLAIDTLAQLRTQGDVAKNFHGELRSLYYLCIKTNEGAYDAIDGAIVPEKDAGESTTAAKSTMKMSLSSEDAAVAKQAFSAPYTHTVTIWSRPLWWSAWQGDHSAVLLRVFDSNGAFVRSVSTRNHGLEASDPQMYVQSTGCPKSWGGRSNDMPPLQPYVTTDLYQDNDAGGCNTPYSISGAAYTHVCNDDSKAEYNFVKNNIATLDYTCREAGLNLRAPACD